MAEGIEPVHPRGHVARGTGRGKRKVDIPERLCRLRDARRELGVLDRARCLGAIQLHTTDAQHRQDRDGQERYTTEIIGNDLQMLDARGGDAPPASAPQHAQPAAANADFDDDIPF